MAGVNAGTSFLERFWEKVTKTDRCWNWNAAHNEHRYGIFRIAGRNEKAHRVAWSIAFGDPGALCVLHRCDNPPCVRPDHLFLGTQEENIQDMLQKGRGVPGIALGEYLALARDAMRKAPHRRARGERAGNAKLSASDVASIRATYAAGMITQKQLGEKYGVTQANVSIILKGDSWKESSCLV